MLRDGASAQYGSDAIAGVINLRLREAREGGSPASSSASTSPTSRPPASRRPQRAGRRTITVSGWVGLPLGDEGFLTLSGEYRDRDPTSRGDLDNRAGAAPARITSRYGDPEVQRRHHLRQRRRAARATTGTPTAGSATSTATPNAATFPRTWNNPNNDPAIYPDGFLPLINPVIDDFTAGWGIKGNRRLRCRT